jgi:DNA-binding GntR family transcriptional regulator
MTLEAREAPVRGSSYVAVAYEQVRGMILAGRLAPGSRVTVRPLAEELELSPTPIRTALAALQRDGLLEVREHRGYFVPNLGREDILELYELREAVDGIASRRAAMSQLRQDLVRELENLLEQQRQCVDAGDIDAYRELDVRFHQAIWQGSGNRRLAAISDVLLGQVRMGNRVSVKAPGRLQPALDEHSAIVEALRMADPEAAEGATRRHVRQAMAALANVLD